MFSASALASTININDININNLLLAPLVAVAGGPANETLTAHTRSAVDSERSPRVRPQVLLDLLQQLLSAVETPRSGETKGEWVNERTNKIKTQVTQ